jgi:hypothetical protein
MNDLLKMLARDPNIAPAFRAVVAPTQKELELAGVLMDLLEYFEQREDISDETNDDGSPRPNEAMQLASQIRTALRGVSL